MPLHRGLWCSLTWQAEESQKKTELHFVFLRVLLQTGGAHGRRGIGASFT